MNHLKVYVNVYDLASNGISHTIGLGTYHSGIEVRNMEYTYSNEGIGNHEPKNAGLPLRSSIYLGTTDHTSINDLNAMLNKLGETFKPGAYHPLKRNCNHFSNALAEYLVNKSIPSWINRMASIGGFFSKFAPKTSENIIENSKNAQMNEDMNRRMEHETRRKTISLLDDSAIDIERVSALNYDSSHLPKNMFTSKKKKTFFASSDDEQAIIVIPFKLLIGLNAINFYASAPKSCPKEIRMYINLSNPLDFDNADYIKADHTVELDQNIACSKNGQLVSFRSPKFRNSKSITIFIVSNYGATTSQLSGIELSGTPK